MINHLAHGSVPSVWKHKPEVNVPTRHYAYQATNWQNVSWTRFPTFRHLARRHVVGVPACGQRQLI